MTPSGTVYLVGAGPGDPELITVKGLKYLRQADVVLYDRLVHPHLLDQLPSRTERIYVGKIPRHHALPQDDINDLLIEKARKGRTVVRLKGGDPFVFGRGGEESAACSRAGVKCEVVPGISSAIAAPASAGIPLTHRGISGSFAVVTGHRQPGQEDVNWSGLSGVDTLVILMGVERLPHIVNSLLESGRHSNTQVAIIERGTLAGQRVVRGILGDIVSRSVREAVVAPATIVMGHVVDWTCGTAAGTCIPTETQVSSANTAEADSAVNWPAL